MRLAVFSHKPCWPCPSSPTGYATDGGFPFQMAAIAELFDSTVLLVPCLAASPSSAETALAGNNLSVTPLSWIAGRGFVRKLLFAFWLTKSLPTIVTHLWQADAVHAPIPGDVGTIGMIGALLLRKPLFVRHCGNWARPRTLAERFWRWFVERFAGGRNVMFVTGGAAEPPSSTNHAVRWIFSTSLSREQLSTYGQRRTALPKGRARLCLVARQDPEKGAGVVIRALPLLATDFPDLQFDVVGGGCSLSEFRKLAVELGVASKVVFHGKLGHEAVMQSLHEADVFCFPTAANDGFPKAVLEGLASGLPAIVTRVSVLPQLVEGGGGVLLEQRTPEALASAVRRIMKDPKTYEAMSAKACETAREYSLERWRDTIGEQLSAAWGPLKSEARDQLSVVGSQ